MLGIGRRRGKVVMGLLTAQLQSSRAMCSSGSLGALFHSQRVSLVTSLRSAWRLLGCRRFFQCGLYVCLL